MSIKKTAAAVIAAVCTLSLCACTNGQTGTSYESQASWVYSENTSTESKTDSSVPEAPPSAIAVQYAEKQDELRAVYRSISDEKDFPVINITTLDNESIRSKDKYVESMVDVFNCGEEYFLSAEAGVKVRGNSTADQGDEKPYRIKFKEKQGMLGLHGGSEYKSWVLMRTMWNLAPDYMGFGLARAIFEGKYYSSDCAYVNLYINGKSAGVYLLCEQNQAADGRVGVTEPKGGELPDEIGYFLEMDNYPDENEHPFFTVVHGKGEFTDIVGEKRAFRKKVYSIRSDTTTGAQREFIAKYMDNVYRILLGASEGELLMMNESYELVSANGVYSSPKEAVEAVIDTESLANMLILEELVQDYDVGEGSFYMAVDFGENSIYPRLTFLAPWDFNWGYSEDPSSGYYACTFQKPAVGSDRSNVWFITAMKQEWFSDIVKEKWRSLRDCKALIGVTKAVKAHTAVLANDLGEESWRTDKAAEICTYVNCRIRWLDTQWKVDKE